ncbi:hypothetical protein BJY52DRAFT_776531 [Lactarius psammicola]|nr:hypothetical protein BJY52DRAFT_776531 [Lactarius psammicola]
MFKVYFPNCKRDFCDMWNELVRSTGNRRSRNLSIYILKHIRNVYRGLHQGTCVSPTAFSSTTSDRDSILLFPQSYPSCTIVRHRPAKEPSPGDVLSALQVLTSVAAPAYTPWIIPVDGESHHLQPILPYRETFGVIQGESAPTPLYWAPTYHAAVPKPSSYQLRRICDRRTETVSNILDANAGSIARAWGAHTPSASSLIALHHSSILETSAPLATHDASLISTSNAGHVGIASVDMQLVDNEPRISQQSILVAVPTRAVLRSPGLHADITRGNTSTFASSTTCSIPDVPGAVFSYPHSFTPASSSIGTVASGDSGDLQIIPAHTVLDAPSSSFPIPVLDNAISTNSQSFATSMSPSDDIPSGMSSLAISSATAFRRPTTLQNTTVPPEQQQSAPLFPAITPDFSRPGTSHFVV